MQGSDHEPRWGLVANVVDERFYGPDGVTRSGTKHFAPGAKVYYHRAYWGMGADQVTVTGRHRGGRRLVTVVMARRHLHNWRARLIYKPAVLRRLASGWYDLADPAHIDDPEARARARAAAFNEAHHFSTFDRPEEEVARLIEHWRQQGHEGLDRVEDFEADRWIVLYERLRPVGIGVSNFKRDYERWIEPGYESGWPHDLKVALALSVPEREDSARLEYQTGLSGDDLSELSRLMSTEFDQLHAATFDADPSDRRGDQLERFALPLLRSPYLDWPPALDGFEREALSAWLSGRPGAELADRLGVDDAQVAAGFDVLRSDGHELVGAAFRLMKTERDYDADEQESLAAVLGRTRLRYGVDSALAYSLVRSSRLETFGLVTVGRVAATTLAATFRSLDGSADVQRFERFALDRIGSWVAGGLIQPEEPSTHSTDLDPLRVRSDGPVATYRVDVCPV